MKKAITSLALCGIILSATAPAAFAATVGAADVPTKGDITFEVNEGGDTEVIIPNEKDETPEVIVPEGGNSHEKGALRIEYVPDFRFGTSSNLTAAEDTKKVQNVKYKLGATTDNEIPPFVQVRDYRGLKDVPEAKWTLSVKATPFTAKETDGTVIDELTGATLKLKGSTLTMDFGTSAKANEMAKGQAADTVIPTDDTGSREVLATQASKTTSGHKVSNVFENGYERAKDYTGQEAAGVEFYKPEGKAPVVGATYESVIKWTLTDAL